MEKRSLSCLRWQVFWGLPRAVPPRWETPDPPALPEAEVAAALPELGGPLNELAGALNTRADIPMRRLVPTGDELLQLYWEHYFS